jgi:hypothetical protein
VLDFFSPRLRCHATNRYGRACDCRTDSRAREPTPAAICRGWLWVAELQQLGNNVDPCTGFAQV